MILLEFYSVEKMSIKKSVIRLEKEFKIKFPELNAAFYSSRRNMNIHMGLEKAFFFGI